MEAIEAQKEEQLLKIKKFRNKFPVSGIILLIIKWLDNTSFSELYGLLKKNFFSHFNFSTEYGNSLDLMFHCCLTSMALISSIITDSCLGKFNALILSQVLLLTGYSIVIAREFLPEDTFMSMFLLVTGLLLVASSTGVKLPCFMCLAGDQFQENQVKERNMMFSFLFLSISFGEIFATFLVPLIKDLECFSKNCYLVYLLASTCIEIFCIVLLIVSKKLFFIAVLKRGKILEIFKCIQFALVNQLRHCALKIPRRDHWLDWALEKFSEEQIRDVKIFFLLLLFTIPFPFLWALSKKQAGFSWQNDEVQVCQAYVSGCLIIIITFSEICVRPIAKRHGFSFTTMRKMLIGMLLIYISMLITLYLELQIEKYPYPMPGPRECYLRVINVVDSTIHMDLYKNTTVSYSRLCVAFKKHENYKKIHLDSEYQNFLNKLYSSKTLKKENILLKEKEKYTLVLYGRSRNFSSLLIHDEENTSGNGLADVKIVSALDKNITFLRALGSFRLTEYNRVSPSLRIKTNRSRKLLCKTDVIYWFTLGLLDYGGNYMYVIIKDTPILISWKIQTIEIKNISFVWQIPQLIIFEIGEFMVQVSCMQFYYAEAVEGMKVTMMALWLNTIFTGFLIDTTMIYNFLLPSWIDQFIFSSIQLALIIIIVITAYYYQETIIKLRRKPHF
ncbi:solute carrier family 15 member 2-like isoform X3 [Monodelphis domestica]|uniref:solute carrier family 15 member 2-like isoform X3 n=1 Tax=Monodelphis domestica TaxID=13616 RepID=UPI000443198C|nr:solute carrier family 15 member 2-like isoform X3 [Monodelphis domestica]